MDVAHLFYKYRQAFLDETRYISNVTQLYNNENYNKIIELGADVIPLMIKDFKGGLYYHWFKALRVLSGADAVKPQHKGFISAMAEDWIDWFYQGMAKNGSN